MYFVTENKDLKKKREKKKLTSHGRNYNNILLYDPVWDQ